MRLTQIAEGEGEAQPLSKKEPFRPLVKLSCAPEHLTARSCLNSRVSDQEMNCAGSTSKWSWIFPVSAVICRTGTRFPSYPHIRDRLSFLMEPRSSLKEKESPRIGSFESGSRERVCIVRTGRSSAFSDARMMPSLNPIYTF